MNKSVETLRLKVLQSMFIGEVSTNEAKQTQAWAVVNELTKDVVQKKEGKPEIHIDDWEDLFIDQVHLVDDLLVILSEDGIVTGLKDYEIWKHPRNHISTIAQKKTDPIRLLEISEYAAHYLEQPYRSNILDKLLVQMLVVAETHAFVDEMYHDDGIKGISQPSLMKRSHPIVSTFKYLAVSGLVLGAPGLVLIANFGGFLSVIGGFLWLVLLVIALILVISIPGQIAAYKKTHSSFEAVISEMQNCYSSLSDTGPLSVSIVQQQLGRSSDKGVIWPSVLFVVLEDIKKRRDKM